MNLARNAVVVAAVVLPAATVSLAQTGLHTIDPARSPAAAAAINRAAIRIDPNVVAPSQASRVIKLDKAPLSATVLRATGATEAVGPAAASAVIEPRAVLVTKTAATADVRPAAEASFAGAQRFVLPYEFRYLTPKHGGGSPNGHAPQDDVRTSRLGAEVAGGGLRLAAGVPGYVGTIHVALEDAEDRTRSYELPEPATILMTAPIDSMEPSHFEIEQIGSWHDVALRAVDPADEFDVKIRAAVDPDDLIIPVAVVRPKLTVVASPAKIAGLGLETANVSVAADGVPDPQGHEVVLAAEHGSLAASTLALDEQGLAKTTIRSISVGSTTVSATSPHLAEGHSQPIEFTWPLSFALAALLGGAIGGLIKHWQGTRAAGTGSRSRLAAAAIGALVGIVVAALYAVGVNVLPIPPSATAGEALVFALAAAGGFLGLRLPQAE